MARKKETEDNKKQVRWDAILELIRKNDIGTQKDLQDALSDAGFEVTQATLSRDIRDLHLVKATKGDGLYAYRLPDRPTAHPASAQFSQLFSASVTKVDVALNQVIIHTYVGMAGAVCAALDGLHWDTVLGSIAGDDTILIITRSEKDAAALAQDLLKQ